ncbi:MAG: chain-length determining protein [Desulfatitalea sp.]|nr:chain-length determining protein [Desulfatitalea sp.]
MVQRGQEFYPDQPAPVNLKEYIQIAKRRKWSFVVPLVLVACLAVTVAVFLPPVYRSSATILIEEQEIPPELVAATVTSFAEQRLQQINQRIMSTSRLMEIIERFGLYRQMREKKTNEQVIGRMRSDVKLNQISADVVDRRTGRPTTATIAFSLSYQGKDSPATIQKVVNVLVSLFLEENLKVRERQTAETSRFFEDEMHRVQAELAQVERKLADFKEKHMNELPELLQLNMQQLGNTERSIEMTQERLSQLQTQEGYLQTQLASVSPFQENSDRSHLQAFQTELATMKAMLSDAHPDVIRTTAAIKSLKEKIATAGTGTDSNPEEPDNPPYITMSSQLAGLKSEIASTKNQLAELRNRRDRYEARIQNTPRVEREYSVLISEQGNLKGKFNELMQKLMEAKVAHGLEKEQKGERFTLIDPPQLPERPFKPNRMAIGLIGLVLGIGAGVGWAALREFSDAAAYSSEKLSASAGFPVLGEVPVILLDEERKLARQRRILGAAALALLSIGAILAFHMWIMDLYVFWAKVDRKLGF